MKPRLPLLVLVIGTLAGCANEDGNTAETAGGEGWTSQTDVVIGDRLEGEALFSWVPYLRARGNRVYVVEPRFGRITVWSTGGDYVGRFGGEGRGPREFLFPYRIGFHPSRLWVRDRQRFTFFSPDLKLAGTVRGPATNVDWRGFPLQAEAILPDSSYLAVPNVLPRVTLGWAEEPPVDRRPILRVPSSDALATDELVWLDDRHRHFGVRDPDGQSSWALMSDQPFADHDLYHVDTARDRVVVARRNGPPGEVIVTAVSTRGDSLARRRLSFDPIPLTPARRDRALERLAENASRAASAAPPGNRPTRSELRVWVEEATYLPDHLPAVSALQGASNGEIWLRGWDAEDGLRAWYALGPDLAEAEPRKVLLPAWFDVLDATDTHVWGVRRDSLDVPYVVGRRLEVRESTDRRIR